MSAVDFFGPLYGVDHVPAGDEDLLFYWAIPASRDIANYVWDTDVPEVTKPWPYMEYRSVRDAMEQIIGSPDVTGYLYSIRQLDEYTQDMEVLRKCDHCGTHGCEDKFCGLRGDDDELRS